ncbi:MAG: sigma-E factor negative regulatory protein, partial [Chitinophagaceae bacterium]|nr:sigma-E factor negative regulatory protein [Rubrivivax sp.]
MNPHSPRDDAPAQRPEDRLEAESRAWLSALADGEGDPLAAERGCAAWREDAGARQAWHTYHLIGDVLRSDELATRPAHDRDFLAALRVKLAAEPVVLAPSIAVPAAPPAGNAASHRTRLHQRRERHQSDPLQQVEVRRERDHRADDRQVQHRQRRRHRRRPGNRLALDDQR